MMLSNALKSCVIKNTGINIKTKATVRYDKTSFVKPTVTVFMLHRPFLNCNNIVIYFTLEHNDLWQFCELSVEKMIRHNFDIFIEKKKEPKKAPLNI